MLEDKNQKLKQLVVDLSPDKKMLPDVLAPPEPAAAQANRSGADGPLRGQRAASLPGYRMPAFDPSVPAVS